MTHNNIIVLLSLGLIALFLTVSAVQATDYETYITVRYYDQPIPGGSGVIDNPYSTGIFPGDTVFIGESNLNIYETLNKTRTIAWYAPGSRVGTDTPGKVITIAPIEIYHFYFDSTRFADYTGPWYSYNATGGLAELAFYVEKPSLKINSYRGDGTTLIDGKKVIADDPVMLKIESTFAPLFLRGENDPEENTFYYLGSKRVDGGDYYRTYFYNITGTEIGKYRNILNVTYGYPYESDGRIVNEDGDIIYRRPVPNYDDIGIEVYAITPDEAKLKSMIVVPNPNDGNFTNVNLQAIKVNRSDFWVNNATPVWSAGRIVDNDKVLGHKILTGEYQFYAEINVNGMGDNLGEITGQTVSNTVKVTVDRETVKITSDKATVIRNNGFSVKVDGTPRALYAVWFTGVSGYNYKEVPAFIKDQEDVTSMSYLQAERTEYKSSHMTIADDLPEGVTEEGDFTGNYAVVAKLAADGSINIGIMTNENTKDTSFTIRAQRIKYLDEPLSPEEYYELDMQLYDTVKVKVDKGAVTVSASGDGSYYLGEEVTLSGTNTDSDDVYLFITGPNLPVAGGKLDAPKTNPTSKDNTRVTVKTDDTWEYKWDTSGSILDAGTYTIYATSDFALKSGINKTLSDVKYDTVSVVIKKPFVTATTSSSTVAKGDKLYIRGTAEGQPTQGVAVWILGKNYWNGEKTNLMESSTVTETVNDDGSFEYELGSADTKDLASGQYFVVVQHPMYNGVFDVKSQKNEDAKTIQVITNPKGAEDVNGVAFIVAGNGKLQGSDAAEALITAINSANVDDTYTKLTFLVEEPWIRVNSVGDHYIGDRFKITGMTNLAVGDALIVEVTSSSFQPTQKTQSGEFSGVSSTVKVNEGSTYNEWALDVDASTFKADEYIVNVEAIEADVTTTTTFNILAGTPAAAPASSSTSAPASLPTGAPATAPTPSATTAPGFGALIALIGLGAAGAVAFVIGKHIR